MIETHSKAVRNSQISLVQGTGKNPSSTAAAMPMAELPAQLKWIFVSLILYISHWKLRNGIVIL